MGDGAMRPTWIAIKRIFVQLRRQQVRDAGGSPMADLWSLLVIAPLIRPRRSRNRMQDILFLVQSPKNIIDAIH